MFGKLNKQIIYSGLVMIFLAIGAFFMVNVKLPPWSHYLSALNVVLFALPTFWAVRWWLGWRDGTTLITLLACFALLIETSAITTGFPYGHFGYSDLLGYRILGLVPWTVAFAWTPLILGAYSLAANLFDSLVFRSVATAVIVTLFDVVLDPGAVLLGFWAYDGGGWFYGVPLSNFGGWLLTGMLGAILIEAFARLNPHLPVPMQLTSSSIFIVFFWSSISAFGGLLVSAVIGFSVVAGLVFLYFRFHYSFDDRIVFVDGSNQPQGTGDKLQSHHSDTQLHRAFSVFLFNANGEFLMQQRALSKKTWPGVWSNSCCGHVKLHESTAAAAKRRLRYELGIKRADLVLALPNFRYRAEKDGVVESEICPVFVGFSDERPHPNPLEVEAVKWLDWNEFVASLDHPDSGISPWAIEEVGELLTSDVFNGFYKSRTARRG